MAAAGIAVSVSAGVMKPLLEKLTKLMGNEYKKLKGLRKEPQDLINKIIGYLQDMRYFIIVDDLLMVATKSSLTEIVDVPSLSHLSTYWLAGRMRLPDGIDKVKSLRSLGTFCLEESSLENIMSVGELTDLRELLFRWCNGKKGVVAMPMAIAALITCLEKLGNLRVLHLLSTKTFCCGDAMLEPIFSPPFYKIEELYLNQLMFSSVPRWIGHLRCLRELDLQAKHIFQEDINIIGTRLTSLFRLFLRMVHVPTERLVIGCSTGFKVLKLFYFDCDGVSCLTFEAGAMPNLQVLRLAIDPEEWDKATPVGLQHLPSLKILGLSVEPDVDVFGTAAEEVMTDVFQKAADALPTRPAVEIDQGSRLEEWRVT
ncbi:hypothetical protein QOZ80_8AG0614630 [Eleusine coracana subsp. coracana]|nr:hypothetical protein QOZ80_8AG0614630 [Eleusine coracana subsp. coracana]